MNISPPPVPVQRSLGPAITLLTAGIVAWVLLLATIGIQALLNATIQTANGGLVVILLVFFALASSGAEVIAFVLGIVLGISAFRHGPPRARVRTIVGLGLIATSIVVAILVLAHVGPPAGYVTG